MPTVRNARGADLYAASDNEAAPAIPIQSKALSKLSPVPLGGSLDTLRTQWWITTVNAGGDEPTCYVMTLDEVKAGAHKSVNEAGKVSYWLQPKAYALSVYKDAWDRLGEPKDFS